MREDDLVVVVCRLDGRFKWYRNERDLWVLDINKWRNEFIDQGYDVPAFTKDFRFGIHVVNGVEVGRFLSEMQRWAVSPESLSVELARRFTSASSWWDVQDLFPIAFIDFDRRVVAGFYPDGVALERFIPDGWRGEFVDFCNEYSEEMFPASEKFWVKDGVDLLQLLNERAQEIRHE